MRLAIISNANVEGWKFPRQKAYFDSNTRDVEVK
jgi:hypothetical protein